MSYGPQLPPHLQKRQDESSSEEDEDEPCGPKLPSEPCRGPKPVGPQLPPHLQQKSEEGSSEDDDCYGPKLPSVACRGPAPGPTRPPGPQLPEEESSDDELIGPLPPKPGTEQDESSIARSIELRAQQMKDRLEGREAKPEPKRETWMLELPTEKAKSFGLGPRQFSRSSNPKPKQDKSWTQAPNQSGSKEEPSEDHSQDEDVLAYMASLQRDVEMEKVAEAYKKKRGNESLVDIHSKKMKAKKSEEKSTERRPFDRNTDLQVNRFDEAQKKAMLKKAAKLDSRFTSGSSKYI